MISPYQLLIALEVKPKAGTTLSEVLAKVHPVLRELGYVDFKKNDDGLITAEDPEQKWAMQAYMFVEQKDDAIQFNTDGTFYFFKPDEQRRRLMKVKTAMENAVPCEASISQADYPRAFLSALFFSVGPAVIGICMAMILGEVMLRIWPVEENVHRTVISTWKYTLFAFIASSSIWRKYRAKGYTVLQGFLRLTTVYFMVIISLYVLAIALSSQNN